MKSTGRYFVSYVLLLMDVTLRRAAYNRLDQIDIGTTNLVYPLLLLPLPLPLLLPLLILLQPAVAKIVTLNRAFQSSLRSCLWCCVHWVHLLVVSFLSSLSLSLHRHLCSIFATHNIYLLPLTCTSPNITLICKTNQRFKYSRPKLILNYFICRRWKPQSNVLNEIKQNQW